MNAASVGIGFDDDGELSEARIANAIDALRRVVAAERQNRKSDIVKRLKAELDDLLAGEDPTGNEMNPGTYWDGTTAIAWDYAPGTNQIITVSADG